MARGTHLTLSRLSFRHYLEDQILANIQSVKRRSDSLSQDVLFSVKHGNLKPRKHILMGLSLKSLTGSKKILTMLNRMGHSLRPKSHLLYGEATAAVRPLN